MRRFLGATLPRAMSSAAFKSKSPQGVGYSFTTEQNQKPSNQDVAGMGQFKEFSPKNPRDFLQELSTKMAQSLAKDERFNSSGSTCNVTIIAGNKLYILSFGDSPTSVSIKDANGNRISVKLTQDHAFSDPEIEAQFKGAQTDMNGVSRYQGLAVPCFGHNRDEKIAAVAPRIYEYDLKFLPAMASFMGIGSKVTQLDLVVASDGLCEANAGESWGGSIASGITTSHEVVKGANGKMQFLKSGAAEDVFSRVIDQSPENAVEGLMKEASSNNSQDNISVAHFTLSNEELQKLIAGENQNPPTAIFVFDGNGVNGHLAAEELAQIVCRELQLEPIAGLPLKTTGHLEHDNPNPTAAKGAGATQLGEVVGAEKGQTH